MSDAAPDLKLSVVGHTNTGKTSLMRTLTRDRGFGRVEPGPSTTRRVEGAALIVGGDSRIGLYDTPGLEAAGEVWEWLDHAGGDRHDGPARVRAFVDGAAGGDLQQEAGVLRQVLDGDAVLYVIDAREPVLGKYMDELAVLALCARPVLPVLNFVAGDPARPDEWRAALARVNLHVQAAFDTVVFDPDSEQKLFAKLALVLDAHDALLRELAAERRAHGDWQLRAGAERVADLLIDIAALRIAAEPDATETAGATLRDSVIEAERRCVGDLLELYRFGPEDYRDGDLPADAEGWREDPFDPETLRHYGLRTGTPLAAGTGAGMVFDVATGGLSLGAGTAVGTVVGGLAGALGGFGRRLGQRFRRRVDLTVGDATLALVMIRQAHLLAALRRRGHASQAPIESGRAGGRKTDLPAELRRARHHPGWCRLAVRHSSVGGEARARVVTALAERLETEVKKQ